MNMRSREWLAHETGAELPRFLLYSSNSEVARSLAQALGDSGLLVQEASGVEQLSKRLVDVSPQLVFLDFTPDDAQPGKLLQSTELARVLARTAPGLPRVAVGSLSRPEGMVAALRAGVSDFVDPLAGSVEILDVVRRALSLHGSPASPAKVGGGSPSRIVLVLGVRAGVGASTLAVHLADLEQNYLRSRTQGGTPAEGSAEPAFRPAALLDLGWPVGDGLLYLNVANGEFHFAEAARNLHRLDQTLLRTALANTRNGLAVLPLPTDLNEMSSVSHADALALLDLLQRHFGEVLIDAGGFPHPEFVAALARHADQTWVVTDQSVGALVSLADMLQDFDQRNVPRARLRLVVNRYDERYGMTCEQIAERFALEALGTIPDRTLPLMVSTNQGRLLHETADHDPYVRAVQGLAATLHPTSEAARPGWLGRWLPGVQNRLAGGGR